MDIVNLKQGEYRMYEKEAVLNVNIHTLPAIGDDILTLKREALTLLDAIANNPRYRLCLENIIHAGYIAITQNTAVWIA